MRQNVQRIDHIAMMYRPENFERAIDTFARTLGIDDFDGPYDLHEFGFRFCTSWTAGWEILAPLGGEEDGGPWWDFLRTRGEGLFSVVFGVNDLKAARDRAIAAGATVATPDIIDGRIYGIESTNRIYDRFEEIVLDDILGVKITLGQIEPKYTGA